MTIAAFTPAPAARIEFDHHALSALCARHGDGTEAYLARRLGEVEAGLARLDAAAGAADYRGIGRACDALSSLAREIGMVTLEHCAAAVTDCLEGADGTALTACVARLLRLGEPESLSGWAVIGAPAA